MQSDRISIRMSAHTFCIQFFFYCFDQLIIPLRIAFLTINNITIIYFFLFEELKQPVSCPSDRVFYNTNKIADLFFSCSDLKTKDNESTGPDNANKCIKKFSRWRNKTQYDHNEIEERPSASTWKCFRIGIVCCSISIQRSSIHLLSPYQIMQLV